MAPTMATVRTPGLRGWRDWRNWRTWPESFAHAWRRSLRFRTLLITLALTAFAILGAFVTMALAIQNDLFDSRVEQVLGVGGPGDRHRAGHPRVAEVTDGDVVALQALMDAAVQSMTRQAGTDMIAAFRMSNEPSPIAPQGFERGVTHRRHDQRRPADDGAAEPDERWWQSIALPKASDGAPCAGVVIGQQLILPEVGAYEFYFAYDLASEAETLRFVQVTLWLVGVGLVLIGGDLVVRAAHGHRADRAGRRDERDPRRRRPGRAAAGAR